MPFEEGVSGNPGGRPKRAKLTYDALLLELKSRESDKDVRGIRKVVQKVCDLAEDGERWAVEFIRDTVDGKPAQAIVGDSDFDPIETNVRLDAERFTRAVAGLVARSGEDRSDRGTDGAAEG